MKLKQESINFVSIRNITKMRRHPKPIRFYSRNRIPLNIWKKYRWIPAVLFFYQNKLSIGRVITFRYIRPRNCVGKIKNDYRICEKRTKEISIDYYVPTFFKFFYDSIINENMFGSSIKGGKLS